MIACRQCVSPAKGRLWSERYALAVGEAGCHLARFSFFVVMESKYEVYAKTTCTSSIYQDWRIVQRACARICRCNPRLRRDIREGRRAL